MVLVKKLMEVNLKASVKRKNGFVNVGIDLTQLKNKDINFKYYGRT